MKLKIKRLHPDAIIPAYQTEGAACFDLHIHSVDEDGIIHTGLAFEVPEGFVMKVYSRSGHGIKHGVRLSNGTGIIDSDYRGEVMLKMHRDVTMGFLDARFVGAALNLGAGDRIAQAMLVEIPRVQFEEVDELSATARGAGGFGSTGGK